MMLLHLFVFILYISGYFVHSSSLLKTCKTDDDCTSDTSCSKGVCERPCLGKCGPEALCIVMKHKAYCFCNDDTSDCFPNKDSIPCKTKCGTNSSCNTDFGNCECNSGYRGNPYKNCFKKCMKSRECSSLEACIAGLCRNPCDDGCGLNALCSVENHINICSCPPGYTGNPNEICRTIAETLSLSSSDICDQCGKYSMCVTAGKNTKCICLRGYVGNPYVSCEKMCLSDEDCTADTVCANHLCKNPCDDVCGENSICSVESDRRKPVCSCREGYSGDASRICTMKIESRFADSSDDEELDCHPKCGENATCSTKYGTCNCLAGYIGNPYGKCHKKCENDEDCHDNETCNHGDCKNSCLNSCGKNAICRAVRHIPVCSCPPGYSGDAFKICKVEVVTQPTIVDVSLCDTLTCGTNAACGMNLSDSCKCLPGYSGNPYVSCSKKCLSNTDCPDEDTCLNKICVNACDDKCGINAICRAKNHKPVCKCPETYTGDPMKICFPKTKGVLVNPSKVPCIKCICKAITGKDDLFSCAEESISIGYWTFAGEDLVGGETFRTRSLTSDFITCMNDKICIINTIIDYTSRALHRLNDVDCDGKLTCADYFAVHKFGLRASFTDATFNTSEAKSFDQCDGHGEKDVYENWSPRVCSGDSYIEILS